MKEVAIRQYNLSPGSFEETFVQDAINSMLREGWTLVSTSVVEACFDKDASMDYSRVMDANVINLKTDSTPYLVCLFQRDEIAKTLYGAKNA